MQIAREKMLNRVDLCIQKIQKTQQELAFWSKELRLVSDDLVLKNEFKFNGLKSGEII